MIWRLSKTPMGRIYAPRKENIYVLVVMKGGDKVVTDLQRDRVDEDETMMGENEVLTDDISRVEDSLGDMQNDEHDAWVKLCMRPVGVKWPDPWCHPPTPDYDNNQWNLAILRVQENRLPKEMEVCPELYTNIIKSLTQQVGTTPICFFDKYHPLIECLAKWLGRHKLNDHEAWRKVKTGMGTKACWLDVEHGKCNQEETSQRKKKKKQKRQGINPFNNMHGKHPDLDTIEEGAMHGNDTRQEAIPVIASINLMGMGGFKTGHAKSKESNPKDNIKESHMSRMDNLFDDLVARRRNNVESGGLIYERNILNRPAKSAPPASSKKNSLASNQDRLTHPINTFHHGTPDQPLVGKPNTTRTHSNMVKDPSIELLETSIRFVLLDDEGNELPSIQEDTSQQPNDNENNFTQGNDRWRMKQERLINIKYMKLITQEQRYEAKRYVIDRLVPLDSSISEWPKPMLEYFRHLCSIYEFGDGTLATTHEKMNSNASLREEHDNMDTIIEEVESEEDGTAEMMKSDNPPIPITSEGTEEELASFEPTDMLVDGKKKVGVN
ncbi:hypothetical protein L1987_04455 [Smallanthus sonchifolius]|uniref:Uncharacterized protein n=1 Tax=Smallanthus sonchifolius TaxID=185202 RepID=A0ACB9KDH8_9ASTR|nr:hypothetical protein L1987_04455 [Smallanthus sonchifolius]